MFLVVVGILVLVYLLYSLSVKEGMDYTAQNQEKYKYYQKLEDTYLKYQNILDKAY
jgi:hypothetical protein